MRIMTPKSQYMNVYICPFSCNRSIPYHDDYYCFIIAMLCILLVISMDDKASTKKTKIIYFYFLKFICVYVEFFSVPSGFPDGLL